MSLYDITIPLNENMAVWPGDAPYTFEWTARMEADSKVNVGRVAMTVHAGTHTDAPLHFVDGGESLDHIGLDVYVGEAVVIDVCGQETLRIEEVRRAAGVGSLPPRILFKTGAWVDYRCFPEHIPWMEPDLPDWLGANGVRLVGLDVPSVDALDSKDLPIHHALYRNGIAILESLCLQRVPEGRYELIALPLALVGADGAPVRAILRDLKS